MAVSAVRIKPGGRLAAKLASDRGSLDPVNRLYPGVAISISIALRSVGGAVIVATFHCVPEEGSRRISVMVKPDLFAGPGIAFRCRLGEPPGLLFAEP